MRKHAFKLASVLSLALLVAFFAPQRAAADDDDPPSRVARLSHTDGSVSFQPGGTDDWVSAVVNRPMTTGDKLWADQGARAELHMGSASIRLGSSTGFSFLNLTDNVAQLQLTEGTLRIRVKRLDENETFEIDTPNLAFSVLRPGVYKINVNEGGDTTVITVRSGDGEVTGGGQAFAIHAQQTGTFGGTDQLNADVQDMEGDDDFDQWCNDRDRHEDHSTSARYVSPDVIGYEDLDDYGGWRPTPEYGTVWFPHVTVVGWAPYHYGHWAYIAPWGYTWVEDEPWGFAPFHYGRWVVVGGVWGWVPCPPRPVAVVGVAYVRPVYAPALVAWVGGPHFAVGVGVGAGVSVGWFPLGPREVYVPSYPVSRTYVNNVNVSNTTVNTTVVNNYYNTTVVNKNVTNVNNVNVTNVKYVNQSVPGAVTATTSQAFTSAQPVAKNVVKVDQHEVANAPVSVGGPAVAPSKQAVLGSGAAAAAKPPAQVANRAVVAKTTPPPPPPSFAKQSAAIQQNGGKPLAMSQMRQIQPEPVRAAAAVKIAPPAKPATPQNVQANRPGQPQNAAVNNNNRPNQNQPNAPQNNSANRPGNPPANPPANNTAPKTFNDRPPSSRPAASNPPSNPSNNVNPQLEQKQQQQQDQLRQKQDQERQKVEQQQQQQRQQAAAAQNAARQDQLNRQHEQQLQQLEQKHDQQQQKLQQQQQQERLKAQPKPDRPPQKNDKPSKPDKPGR